MPMYPIDTISAKAGCMYLPLHCWGTLGHREHWQPPGHGMSTLGDVSRARTARPAAVGQVVHQQDGDGARQRAQRQALRLLLHADLRAAHAHCR